MFVLILLVLNPSAEWLVEPIEDNDYMGVYQFEESIVFGKSEDGVYFNGWCAQMKNGEIRVGECLYDRIFLVEATIPVQGSYDIKHRIFEKILENI